MNIQVLRSAPNPCNSRTGTRSPSPSSRQRSRSPATSISRGPVCSPSACSMTNGSTTAKPATNASISASGTSSPATTASRPPTGNVVPAGARIRRNVPASDASTTLVILVVSISRISSPSAKRSPCCLSQPTTFPSVMVRPHFGIVTALMAALIARIREPRGLRRQCAPGSGCRAFRAMARTAPGCAAPSLARSEPSARQRPGRRRVQRCR